MSIIENKSKKGGARKNASHMAKFNFYLKPDHWEYLRLIAEDENRSRSDLIRNLLYNKIKKYDQSKGIKNV